MSGSAIRLRLPATSSSASYRLSTPFRTQQPLTHLSYPPFLLRLPATQQRFLQVPHLPAHDFIRWQRSRSGAIPRLLPSFFRQHSRSADAADPTPSPLQVLALFFRPNKEHEYRVYWNFYHHIVGCAVIILGIINVFEGFSILNQWKNAYIIVIGISGAIAVLLEILTWKWRGRGESLPV